MQTRPSVAGQLRSSTLGRSCLHGRFHFTSHPLAPQEDPDRLRRGGRSGSPNGANARSTAYCSDHRFHPLDAGTGSREPQEAPPLRSGAARPDEPVEMGG